MPIRTNRGRAAVYRKLWGWPMRSPTHLVILVVVVAVLVIAVSVLVPQLIGSDGEDSGAAAETTDQTTTGDTTEAPGTTGDQSTPGGQGEATTSLPTRIPSPPQEPTPADPAPEALDVATSWGQAWVHHPEGTTPEKWLDGLRPFTTEEYMVEMATVAPENVPATKVTGPPVPKESYTSSVMVHLPTDGGTLAITLISTPQGWRVTSYEQVA